MIKNEKMIQCSGPKGCSYNHEVIVKAGVAVRGNSSIIARL